MGERAMFAEVVVNRAVYRRPPAAGDPIRDDAHHERTLTYRLPEALVGAAQVGQLVRVPLQAGAVLGVVTAISAELPPGIPPDAVRDLDTILDLFPVVNHAQIDLARWMAREYLAPLGLALRLMLPPGLDERTKVLVQAGAGTNPEGISADVAQAYGWLREQAGPVRQSALLARIRADDPQAVLDALLELGLMEARYVFEVPVPAAARVQYVARLADERAILDAIPRLGRPSKQADVLLALARHARAPVTLEEVCERVGCTTEPVRALEARGWVEITPARTMVISLSGSGTPALDGLDRAPKQAAVLEALDRMGGLVEWRELAAKAGAPPNAIRELERKGLLRRVAEPSLVLLHLPVEQVLDKVVELRGGGRERAVLEALSGVVGRAWVGGIYAQTGADLGILQRLAERGLISLHPEARDLPQPSEVVHLPPLSEEQAAVWSNLKAGLRWQEMGEQPFVGLLHGASGQIRTELLLRAVEAVLRTGRRAMVLVPEIGRASELARSLEARLPGRSALLHGQLSLGQRYAAWDRIRRGSVDVVIGSRSALLTPLPMLGLIVVDEVHEAAYKQEAPLPAPAYHACAAAVELGRLAGAAVILGSATPDVGMYHAANSGAYRLLRLPRPGEPRNSSSNDEGGQAGRGRASVLPSVRVVDMRQELRAGNRSIFSRVLQEDLHRVLEAGAQSILFVNRRGSATFVLCRTCGAVVGCPRCEIPLALHRSSTHRTEEWLVCHRCNHREPVVRLCRACGSAQIRSFGLGTERVEAAVAQLLPAARLLRWDREAVPGAADEQVLQDFRQGRADVLIGTQLVAKATDLPIVMLVGVVSADTALGLPDFTASERTFQILTQVMGKAGDAVCSGEVIVQTYQPEHYAIQAAASRDYEYFYRQEVSRRRALGYPPFGRLVALRYSHVDSQRVRAEMERVHRWLASEICRLGLPDQLIGPAPCFYGRMEGRYRWQVVVRTPDPARLLRGVILPQGWHVDVDPITLL